VGALIYFSCGHTLKLRSLRELVFNSLKPHSLKVYPY